MPECTETVGLIIIPLSLITITIGVDKTPIPLDLVIVDFSLKQATSRPDEQPPAMSFLRALFTDVAHA